MGPPRLLPLPPFARAWAAALPFLLAATIPLRFEVLLQVPPGDCSGEAVSDAALASYRAGAAPLHVGVVVLALAAIALIGDRPGRGPFGLGLPTLSLLAPTIVATAVFAVAAALHRTDEWLLAPLLPFMLAATLIAILAVPLGPLASGLLAAFTLAAIAAGVWTALAHDGRTAWPRAFLWTLVLLTGGHLLIVWVVGNGGIGC